MGGLDQVFQKTKGPFIYYVNIFLDLFGHPWTISNTFGIVLETFGTLWDTMGHFLNTFWTLYGIFDPSPLKVFT